MNLYQTLKGGVLVGATLVEIVVVITLIWVNTEDWCDDERWCFLLFLGQYFLLWLTVALALHRQDHPDALPALLVLGVIWTLVTTAYAYQTFLEHDHCDSLPQETWEVARVLVILGCCLLGLYATFFLWWFFMLLLSCCGAVPECCFQLPSSSSQ